MRARFFDGAQEARTDEYLVAWDVARTDRIADLGLVAVHAGGVDVAVDGPGRILSALPGLHARGRGVPVSRVERGETSGDAVVVEIDPEAQDGHVNP